MKKPEKLAYIDRSAGMKWICGMGLFALCLLFTGCSEAKKAYNDGVALMEKEDYEAAADSFKVAIEENGEKAEYYIAYGMAMLKDGSLEAAIKAFDKAILEKDNKIVRENNKQAYRGRGIAYYECHEYEKAVENYSDALAIKELEDMDAELLRLSAEAMQLMGDYDAALENYEQLVKLDKKDEAAFLGKAALETDMGKYEDAIKDYDAALKLNKKCFDAYFGKYEAYEKQGNEKQAESALQAAADIKIKNSEDKYNVARAFFYKGDYGTAEEYLKEALDEGNNKAWYFLGQISQAKPDYDTAVQQYEQYIAATDNLQSAMVYNQLAGCLMEKEDYVRALGYALEGIELGDKEAEKALLHNTIIIYERLGEFKKARSLAKDYVKAYPEEDEMRQELKFIKSRIPKKKKADASTAAAVE